MASFESLGAPAWADQAAAELAASGEKARPRSELLFRCGARLLGCPALALNRGEGAVEESVLAGVIVAGMHTNEIFIENGRFHGQLIAEAVANSLK